MERFFLQHLHVDPRLELGQLALERAKPLVELQERPAGGDELVKARDRLELFDRRAVPLVGCGQRLTVDHMHGRVEEEQVAGAPGIEDREADVDVPACARRQSRAESGDP